MEGELWCANGLMCNLPKDKKAIRLNKTQKLVAGQLEATDPKQGTIQVYNSMMVKQTAGKNYTGSVFVDQSVMVGKKLCMGDLCIDRNTMEKLLSTAGVQSAPAEVTRPGDKQ